MVVFPHCKINLGLHIVEKRADGYHNIETCFYPVPFTDILEVIKAESFSFSQSGIAVPGAVESNLCVKAYQLLKQDFSLPAVHMHLHKAIPTGAGLGGGSADAAFTIRALNSLFELNLTLDKQQQYAAALGSDCAFFIQDKPMIGKGRGELLTTSAVSLSGRYLVLVKPEIHISTAEAYAGVTPKQPSIALEEILNMPVAEWKNRLKNDFEPSVFARQPLLAEIKQTLYNKGAAYACMSGSGATVYGVFEQAVDLQKTFSAHTYWAGWLP